MHDFQIRRAIEHGMFIRDCRPPESRGCLLYIHGLGESGLCFEHLLLHPGLADRRQLVPDLPGYGRSPWPEQPLDLAAQADHLAHWLRESESVVGDTSPLVVIGHSQGGIVGLLLAESYPDLVAGLVDVDGNKCHDDCVFSGRAAEYSESEFLKSGFDRLRETVHRRGRGDMAQRGYYVSLRLADPTTYHRNSVELLARSDAGDLASRLAALPMPFCYLAGVPNGVSERSHALLDAAGVDWIRIEPSGHWPFIDQPDAFVAELNRFLASLT
ncbi:MAG: alpha/beta hydrolase [bacterium]